MSTGIGNNEPEKPEVAETSEFISLRGLSVPRERLRSVKAIALFDILSQEYPFASLVDTLIIPALDENSTNSMEALLAKQMSANGSNKEMEAVILDVDVEVSQRPVNDIRRKERIAVTFSLDDEVPPEPLALRRDFPVVPHLNVRIFDTPRSICLSDQPYCEDKLRWTPARFIETLRAWLALTAKGKLHQEDQPLEPLIMGTKAKIILPYNLFDQAGQQTARLPSVVCHRITAGDGDESNFVAIMEYASDPRRAPEASAFVAIPLVVQTPLTHGTIHRQPHSFYELHTFLEGAGADLLGELRQLLFQWGNDPAMLKRKPILIIGVQKRREDNGPIEAIETWAFLTDKTLEEIQVDIGSHARFGDQIVPLLQMDETKKGEDIALSLMLPYYTLTRKEAAIYNGLTDATDINIVAIGLGSLGSQVFTNLIRSGFGRWVLVDNDQVLPHNPARHELYGNTVGYAKVLPLADFANGTFADTQVAIPLPADVLNPGKHEAALWDALKDASLILDMSASVAVGRHLARDIEEIAARRASLFLSPTGADLVLISEDSGRRHRLDALEMQYYRALVISPELAGHLNRSGEDRVRYGRSCRDVSSKIAQENVALHAAIGSRAVRKAVETPHAQIRLWRSEPDDMTVSCIPVPIFPVEETELGAWTLITDAFVIDQIRDLRAAKLPAETGGVLLGAFDTQRRIVYISHLIQSPPDSIERSDLYIRGSQGLRDNVKHIEQMTGSWLRYVGEWHSHPKGYSTNPSADDLKLFQWLTEKMAEEGLPSLALICGDKDHKWFLGEMNAVE